MDFLANFSEQATQAPKGRNMTAQGNALGFSRKEVQPCKGKIKYIRSLHVFISPLQGSMN